MDPEDGNGGRRILAQWTPEDVAWVKESYTGSICLLSACAFAASSIFWPFVREGINRHKKEPKHLVGFFELARVPHCWPCVCDQKIGRCGMAIAVRGEGFAVLVFDHKRLVLPLTPCLVAAISLLYSAILITLSIIKKDNNAGFSDGYNVHLPLINWFIEHGYTLTFPTTSLTAPGFHWVIAFIAQIAGFESLGPRDWPLVLLPALFSFGVLLSAFYLLQSCGAPPFRGCLLLVPIAASQYFWWYALYPMTESLGLIGYCLMALAAARPNFNTPVFAVGGIIATFVRQIYWPVTGTAILCLGASAWRGDLTWRKAILHSIVAVAPATIVLIILILSWGGLVPPGWNHHKPRTLLNVTAIAHGVMLIGFLGVPFIRPADVKCHLRWSDFALSLTFATICWFALPLGYDADAGRWGSIIWRIASISPTIGDRPLVLAPLLVFGCEMLLIALRRAQSGGVLLPPELVMIILCFIAVGAQVFSWQRYFEIPSLMFLCCSLARTSGTRTDFATVMVFVGYFLAGAYRI